jgi:protein CpxP
MNRMKSAYKHIIAAAALSALGLGAVSAVAQTTPAQRQGGDATMGHRAHGAADPAKMQERMAQMQARMSQRLAELKQKLQLSPGQELAWTTYTEALKPIAMTHPDRADMAKLTTPERIDRMKSQRAAHMAEMDKRADATKTFYSVLTPEQKKVFDEQTLRRGGHHGGGHGAGDGGHHRDHKGSQLKS